MPDATDVIHLEGEPARALAAHLTQALQGTAQMSETVAPLLDAIRANTDVTASLRQAVEAMRTQQQTQLNEALARVETEVAARVQAEADRDAIRAAIEEARTAIEADTAQESELLAAVTANTTAQPPVPETPPAPTPEPTPPVAEEPAPVVPTPDAAPTPAPDAAPVTDPAVATDPAATPGDATPATNGIGQSFNADGTPVG